MPAEFARAYFIRTADEAGGGADAPEGSGVGNAPATVPQGGIAVQFNPLSLQYGLAINNPQPGQRPDSTQHASRAEATLDMDLVFDTTPQGSDVRQYTIKLRLLATGGGDSTAQGGSGSGAGAGSAATGSGGGSGGGTTPEQLAPPKVAFVWGTFRFVGTLTGFRETLDFFSAEGVPLRSSVHVSLRGVQNSEVFPEGENAPRRASLASGLGGLPAGVDNMARGDAAKGRAAGAALGAASLRVGVGASVGLGGAASLGLSASAGAGGAGGLGLGASVSVTAGAQSAGAAASGAAALDKLAQQQAARLGSAKPALNGPFGFGGRVQSEEPSGLTARLGRLDFSSSSS